MEQLPPLRLIPSVIYCHICGVISLDNKEKSPAPSTFQARFLALALPLLILSDLCSSPAGTNTVSPYFQEKSSGLFNFGICITSLEFSVGLADLCSQMEHPWLRLSPPVPRSCFPWPCSGTTLQSQVQIVWINSLPTWQKGGLSTEWCCLGRFCG